MAATETRFRVMASQAHVVVVDGPPEAGNVAHRALDELEQAWSRFLPDSDISRLNRSPGIAVDVDPLTITLVDTMVQAWRDTAGRFDPTVLPALVRTGYGRSIDDPRRVTLLPEDLSALHDEVAGDAPTLSDVAIDRAGGTITRPPGLVLDAGGIGKGLAADLVAGELLRRSAAGALVCIGGDLAAAGTPPAPDGWPIRIEHPLDARADSRWFDLSGGGVATSSTRSRRWTHREVSRHHVIDPLTGAMSSTDLAAVTVVAACGWRAEVHATAALLEGSTGFEASIADRGLDALATTLDGRTIASGRLADPTTGRPEALAALRPTAVPA